MHANMFVCATYVNLHMNTKCLRINILQARNEAYRTLEVQVAAVAVLAITHYAD